MDKLPADIIYLFLLCPGVYFPLIRTCKRIYRIGEERVLPLLGERPISRREIVNFLLSLVSPPVPNTDMEENRSFSLQYYSLAGHEDSLIYPYIQRDNPRYRVGHDRKGPGDLQVNECVDFSESGLIYLLDKSYLEDGSTVIGPVAHYRLLQRRRSYAKRFPTLPLWRTINTFRNYVTVLIEKDENEWLEEYLQPILRALASSYPGGWNEGYNGKIDRYLSLNQDYDLRRSLRNPETVATVVTEAHWRPYQEILERFLPEIEI